MSISLQQLQQQFQDYILKGDPTIVNEIVDSEKVTAISRMDIYRNAYYLRLIDILSIDFPVVKQLIGQQEFIELAKKYIDIYPSDQFSIRIFGRYFSEFIATQVGSALAEVALLEWKLARILDAADGPHLTLEEMTTISPENWAIMQFDFHPTVEILAFNSNATLIWQAYQENQILPAYESSEQEQYYLIWRKQQQAYFMPINEYHFQMIQALQEGKTFGEVCEELCSCLDEEQVVQFVAGSLRNWVAQGIFSKVYLLEDNAQ